MQSWWDSIKDDLPGDKWACYTERYSDNSKHEEDTGALIICTIIAIIALLSPIVFLILAFLDC